MVVCAAAVVVAAGLVHGGIGGSPELYGRDFFGLDPAHAGWEARSEWYVDMTSNFLWLDSRNVVEPGKKLENGNVSQRFNFAQM